MNETKREIALAAAAAGGLLLGTVAVGQATGGPAPIQLAMDAKETRARVSLAPGRAEVPGTVWVAVPACTPSLDADPVEIRDVRLVGGQGLQVEAVFVDGIPAPDSEEAQTLEGGSGIGWPRRDDGFTSWGSTVSAFCGDQPGDMENAERVHVVMSAQDLGADRIPSFDGLEVDWSDGGSTQTSRLAIAMGWCPEDRKAAACEKALQTGEERREAIWQSWSDGDDEAPSGDFWRPSDPSDIGNLPDVRQGDAGRVASRRYPAPAE